MTLLPRVFVFEYLTAHGIGRDPGSPDHGMYREGRAMRDAIVRDLRRLSNSDLAFDHTSIRAEWAMVVAPEEGGHLQDWCTRSIEAGCRLLGPSPAAIEVTADKLALSRIWEAAGVPTPRTGRLNTTAAPTTYPQVWKPIDGCGSTSLIRLDTADEMSAAHSFVSDEGRPDGNMLAQDFVPGRPASVAFLIGPNQTVPLRPTFQRLSTDGRFQYLGGELPIPPALAERAVALGRKAIDCVPGLAGYVGVDLILGDAADGSRDFAIEINPRLTTSYVGLRALAETNLAGAMLDICQGKPIEPIRWKPGRVRFEPDGGVVYDPTPGAGWA